MNQQIKFRIWDENTQTFLQNTSDFNRRDNLTICPFTGKVVNYVELDDGDHGPSYVKQELEDYFVERFTGLLDKNGREIYEGDIISGVWEKDKTQRISEVLWYPTQFLFSCEDTEGIYDFIFPLIEFRNITVVGNVRENPKYPN